MRSKRPSFLMSTWTNSPGFSRSQTSHHSLRQAQIFNPDQAGQFTNFVKTLNYAGIRISMKGVASAFADSTSIILREARKNCRRNSNPNLPSPGRQTILETGTVSWRKHRL